MKASQSSRWIMDSVGLYTSYVLSLIYTTTANTYSRCHIYTQSKADGSYELALSSRNRISKEGTSQQSQSPLCTKFLNSRLSDCNSVSAFRNWVKKLQVKSVCNTSDVFSERVNKNGRQACIEAHERYSILQGTLIPKFQGIYPIVMILDPSSE